ncbi:hypothetical protein [Lujinxingia sediminis]|uniref:hypothetical protein n=1 Tax=Lujinxingia sediminis TaxID=2480984 RepID=UPI0013E320BD|nr:hypothetical protein [Lujinxingia sediminis]
MTARAIDGGHAPSIQPRQLRYPADPATLRTRAAEFDRPAILKRYLTLVEAALGD